MILAIIFAQVWGVIQLIVLTSLARTVRVRTVLAAMAVGFYAIGPVTAFLQLSWIRIAAHVFGKAVFDLTGVAAYTVDPFIEEAMKLLPLLVLFLIPAIRRQWQRHSPRPPGRGTRCREGEGRCCAEGRGCGEVWRVVRDRCIEEEAVS